MGQLGLPEWVLDMLGMSGVGCQAEKRIGAGPAAGASRSVCRDSRIRVSVVVLDMLGMSDACAGSMSVVQVLATAFRWSGSLAITDH